MPTFYYHGYTIECRQTSKWGAIITRPGTSLPAVVPVKASISEGIAVLLVRAHQWIDEDILGTN